MLRNIITRVDVRLSALVLAFIFVIGCFGPLLAPYDPLAGGDGILQHPSPAHWLGTDYLGRDVLSRILDGSPVSMWGAIEVAIIALVVGAVPGVLSVSLGRVFEWWSLRFVDTLIALPFLVFAVAITALLGNGLAQAMFAVGLLASPVFFRVSRAAALGVARSQYVEAAILNGATTVWIVRKHVWMKVMPPVLIALANTTGAGLVIVASLTFLGIGVQPPAPTWGGVLAADLGYLSFRPFAPVAPTLLIISTVLALNVVADAIRDAEGVSARPRRSARREMSRSQTREAARR